MKKLINLLSIILICFFGTTAKANPSLNKTVDSLRLILSKTKNSHERIDILNKLSKTERELGNYNAAFANLEELIKISNRTRNIKAKGDAYDNIGHIFLAKNEVEKALNSHLIALALHKKAKDDYGYGNSCDNIGEIYLNELNNYIEALIYFKKALTLYEKQNDDKHIAKSLSNIVMCYRFLDDYPEALKYSTDALKISQKIKDSTGISAAYQALGQVYLFTKDDKKALEYFQEALKISEKLNDYDNMMQCYTWIAQVYYERNQTDKVIQYYNKVLALGKKVNSKSVMTTGYYGIASKVKWKEGKLDEALYYLDLAEKGANESYEAVIWSLKAKIFNEKQEYIKAKEYIDKSIAYRKMTKEKELLSGNYETLSSINENIEDYKAALANYKLYKIYQDSINQDDISKTVMKYEFEKKETEIKDKQQEELNRKALISNTVYGILGTTILLIGIILYMLRLRNKKLSAEKQNLEFKHREAQLAIETEEFKARFLSNISHEFRTPLTLINGHLEILKKDGDAKDKKRFDEMEYSGQRLLQLINQLLDLTKLEKNKYQLYYKKANLLNEAQNYIEAFHSLAEQRNINLTTEITESAQSKFSQNDFAYSSETLASVFNNLISNSIKFTPIGGNVHSKIDFKENKLYFSVSDTGTGIPEEDLPHIFDRFYQVVNKEKPIYEGSGIGLSIVKELALLHGGDAIAENNENGGCTFKVWLSEGENISDAEGKLIKIPEKPTTDLYEEENQNPEDEEKPLILVVEDQRELRKFVVENLGNNFRFMEAENGKQGAELALEHLPDVVISDVMMPEMDGFQLCKTIKENEITSHIPVILLTAKSDQNDKIEGLEIGADDYLTKPFSISELTLRVKSRIRLQENLRKKFVGNTIPITENVSELNQRDRNFLEKLNNIVRKNIEKELSDVTTLATEIGLSSSQLTRKLKALTGQTPANFINNIQMDIALQLLQNGDSVSEAAWKIGFSEPAYFTKVFKKHFGFLPSEKNKFGKPSSK